MVYFALIATLLAAPAANPPQPPPRVIKVGAFALPSVIVTIAAFSSLTDSDEREVIFEIDSPGGSESLGMQFIGMVRAAKAKGLHVQCRIPPGAMAASMGAIFFESVCDTREMGIASSLLFHEPLVKGADGNEWELRRVADELADLNQKIAILVSARFRHSDGKPWSPAEYKEWIRGRDRWIGAQEAKEIGAAD